MTRKNRDTVAVVGAGVVGLCTALELIRAGFKVSLFDREPPAKQTSFGNAGYLAAEYMEPLASPEHIFSALRLSFSDHSAFKVTPDHGLEFLPWAMRFIRQALPENVERNQLAMSRLNRSAIEAWKNMLGFANALDELQNSGFLKLWENPQHLHHAKSAQQAAQQWGFDPQLLSGEALFEQEPALAKNINHALYYPGALHLGDPHRTCLKLFDCFKQNGGNYQQLEIQAITPHRASVTVTAPGQQHTYDKLVVAAGAWSKQLLKQLAIKVPLEAERGYHLTLPNARGTLRHILSSSDRNVVLSPLDCGLRIVGFGEYANLKSKPINKRYLQLRRHLGKLIPNVDTEHPDIQTWMGNRPTLPDSLPVIDLHPGHAHIGLVFGHHHLGVTHAGVSAKMLRALMAEGKKGETWKPFKESPDAYSVARF
ncbi:MAG: FAD-binding oxidoreductase [Proteobacteria bacterium]|nr:FAD-binding oxidoreductase [Pseudomonadota bacterium]